MTTYTVPPSIRLDGLVFGTGALWAIGNDSTCDRHAACGRLLRMDPTSGHLVAALVLTKDPIDAAVGEGGLWVPC